MRTLIVLLASISIALPICAHSKEFTRDYIYRAGDDDSKNTARTNAIEQVKLLLLEEIGVYIQSYIEIDKIDNGNNSSSFLSHEIRTTTAGVTKTKILTEEWSGKEYKLRARITVDVEDVIKRINETIKTRENSKNIAELNVLLKTKNDEIIILSATLKNKKQESKNQQIRLEKINVELKQLKVKLKNQIEQEKKIITELERIKNRISITSSAAKKFTIGMTKSDLIRIAGRPSSESSCASSSFLNYGKYWANMESGIFKRLVGASTFRGPCSGY